MSRLKANQIDPLTAADAVPADGTYGLAVVGGVVTGFASTAVANANNAQTGTTYTLVLADAGKWVTMNNASASSLVVPTNAVAAFPIGTQIEGAQLGAGQVTISGAGVTLRATPGLKIAAQYGVFGLRKIATDEWVVYGRLSA